MSGSVLSSPNFLALLPLLPVFNFLLSSHLFMPLVTLVRGFHLLSSHLCSTVYLGIFFVLPVLFVFLV